MGGGGGGGRLGRYRRPDNHVSWIAAPKTFLEKKEDAVWGLCSQMEEYGT